MKNKFGKQLLAVLLTSILGLGLLSSCSESFIDDMYVEPNAAFTVEDKNFEVFETVRFVNAGEAQTYSVYPGDDGHVYGESGAKGYATASDGTFSYSYQEPGEYNVVWIASSIKANGEIVSKNVSKKVVVVSTNGGLERLDVQRIFKMTDYGSNVYYTSHGQFVSADTIMCPIIFDAWRASTSFNSIKAKQLLSFDLSSTLATFWWTNENNEEVEIKSEITSSKIVNFLRDGKLAVQKFTVKAASGNKNNYYVAPVMIPKMTKFSIGGVEGVITRDVSSYGKFIIKVKKSSLPAGTDMSKLIPQFEIMNNDANLVDATNVLVSVNGVAQESGKSTVDATSGTIDYKVRVGLLGCSNQKLAQEAEVTVVFE